VWARLSQGRDARVTVIVSVLFACLLSLAMQRYQFGKSNHTVYLIDALRQVHPQLLANDWFTTKTLQYHATFGWITRGLMRAGIVQPAFLIGYLGLVVALHVAWWRIVAILGGSVREFIMSEVLFALSAGGTGLGMYQFLQDSAFLPSNIAAVAMLWAIARWLEDRPIASGVCLGLAGLLHLNFALVGVGLWVLLWVCVIHTPAGKGKFDRAFWLGTLAAAGPSLVCMLLAARAIAGRGPPMPLQQFVALYVKLRHPHHYDPWSWPAWLWISFLWPMPVAFAWWVRMQRRGEVTFAWMETARIFFIFALLVIVALIGAGVAWESETLIQASLYRFSIYPKLLSCIAAAFLICAAPRRNELTIAAAALGVALIGLCLWRGPYLGLFRTPEDDASYIAACDWIRDHTPADAVFLVPPSEQEFRLRAQRAIVVNFKGVPQLSSELPEWRDRMRAVLNMEDLTRLPRPFAATLAAIRDRYDSLPPEYLEKIARQYGARYVVADHRFAPAWDSRRVDIGGSTSWFLYDLSR
jgi:Domain of unknown function (DUF6798)